MPDVRSFPGETSYSGQKVNGESNAWRAYQREIGMGDTFATLGCW